MPLSSEEIAAAEKVHRFVREYERQRGALPWTACTILPSLLIMIAHQAHHRDSASFVLLGVYVVIIFFGFVIQRFRGAWYRDCLVILAVLKREHGNELPWVALEKEEAEVEKHLAAVKELEQELANRHVTP
jgi:hypothetical protein